MKLSARTLLAVSALMILRNLGAAWGELHDWHGVTATLDPAFVSRAIGDMLPAITAFAAGLGFEMPSSMRPTYAGPDRRDPPPTV